MAVHSVPSVWLINNIISLFSLPFRKWHHFPGITIYILFFFKLSTLTSGFFLFLFFGCVFFSIVLYVCWLFWQEKQEAWWLYVADKKRHLLVTAPVYVCSLKTEEEVYNIVQYSPSEREWKRMNDFEIHCWAENMFCAILPSTFCNIWLFSFPL
jgi:hypothetical protein